ncbi:MAG: beta-glucanase, partial [Prevotella sp.]|nr:beta-glucanase [Prevotella sp.]
MKKVMLLSLITIFSLHLSAQDGIIRPGQLWLDTDGNHINAHGGGVLLHEGTYYWFGEHKSERTSNAMVGITCYASTNL